MKKNQNFQNYKQNKQPFYSNYFRFIFSNPKLIHLLFFKQTGLDWSNVFAAGGSVLACLQPVPASHNANNPSIRNYYHKEAYKNSDIDLFIYGIHEEEANKKMTHISKQSKII